jgi:adiponectin receptor
MRAADLKLISFFQVSRRCHALDYSGIVVLTVGSFYTCLYYGFYCEPLLQAFYLLSITLAGLGK